MNNKNDIRYGSKLAQSGSYSPPILINILGTCALLFSSSLLEALEKNAASDWPIIRFSQSEALLLSTLQNFREEKKE